MSRVLLRDMRSLGRVAFALPEPGEVVLIAGPNRAGKTTIAKAVAALLTRDPSIFGTTRKAAEAMVGGVDRNPEISLADEGHADESAISYRFPERKRTDIGPRVDQLPTASSIAVGSFRPAAAKSHEVAAWLALGLDALPTVDEFAVAAKAAGIADVSTPFVKLAHRVSDDFDGWDQVTAAIDAEARAFKARWTEVADGRAYGSALAPAWVPKKWRGTDAERADMAGTIARLELEEAEAAEMAKGMQFADAAADAERDQLERAVILGEEAAKDLPAARKTLAERRTELERLRVSASPVIACPHCRGMIRLDRSGPVVAETGAKAAPKGVDEAAIRLAEAGLEGAIRREEALARTAGAGRSAETALKLLPAKRDRSTADPTLEIRERLEMARKIARADEIHAHIAKLQVLSAIASPTGLRAVKMMQRLVPFRRDLFRIAELMGLLDLTMDDDLQFAVAGRPYAALCESEQWQVDAAIALTVARMDQSAIVILDRADILEASLRNKLFWTLKKAGVATLVTMTANARGVMPDLVKAKLGRSYWLADGELHERAAA